MVATLKTLIENENWKKAFSAARKFFFGLNADEKRHIEIAADYLNGNENFYKSLGVDCLDSLNKAKAILRQKSELIDNKNADRKP